MPLEVRIDMFGDTLFRRRIQAMRHRSRNMSPVLEDVGEKWIDIIEEQFDMQGARTGKKWAKLEFDTIKRRGSAKPVLIDKGDMFDFLLTPDNLSVTDDSVTYDFGENAEIAQRAEAHQFGFINAMTGKPVPARPIVGFLESDEEMFRDMIQDFLVRGDRSQ